SLERMYRAMSQAAKSGELDKAVEREVRDILSGKGGVLKIVIDVDRFPQRLTPETREAVLKLLEDAVQKIMFEVNEVKTKIQIVMRRQFDAKSDKEVRAL